MPNPKTFGELVTFTPLFDEVIDAFRDTTEKGKQGPFIEALVFGLIWRRCQGDLGIFYMTLQNGADTLGLSKSTFQRAITKLLEAGFIFKSDGYLKIHGSSGRPLAIYSIYPELIEAIDQIGNITLTLDEILPISQSGQRDHFKVVRETTSKWSERPPKKEHKERNNKKEVVVKLSDFGISDKRIQEIISNYQTAYITEKLEILEWKLGERTPGRSIKDPAAWLIKAIEKDYHPPKGFKLLADLEKGKEEEHLRQEEMETERLAEREREKKKRAKAIEAHQIPEKLLGTWKKVLEEIGSEGNYQALLLRLENSFLLSIEDDIVTILVEGADNQNWLEDRAASILKNELTGYLGKAVKVQFEGIQVEE